MRMFRSVRNLVLATLMLSAPLASFAGVFLSVSFGPPALPVYEQPLCPGDGYIWTPGYWAYGDEGYFWVPGTWVMAPRVGYLWTPGYWGWGGSAFLFHEGYWGPHIGYYGGINYGFGYIGHGYEGGYWDQDHFRYNSYVNRIDETRVHNVYNKTVINNVTVNRVSYNGGNGGINDRPRPEELQAVREQHIQATSVQTQHFQAASTNRAQYVSVNHGQPAVAATPRPGAFNARGVVPARSANVPNNMANRGAGPGRAAPAYNGGNNSRPQVTARPNTVNGNRPAYQPGNSSNVDRGNNDGYNNNGNYNRNPNTNNGNYNRPTQDQRPQASRPAPSQPQYARPTQSQPQYARPQNQAPPQSPEPRQQNAAPRQQTAPRSNPATRESAPRPQEEHGGDHQPHGGGR